MPTQLPSDAVGNRSYKLAAKAKFGTEFGGKFLGAVVFFRHVPLELVGQWDVANMYIQLEITH